MPILCGKTTLKCLHKINHVIKKYDESNKHLSYHSLGDHDCVQISMTAQTEEVHLTKLWVTAVLDCRQLRTRIVSLASHLVLYTESNGHINDNTLKHGLVTYGPQSFTSELCRR